MRSVATAAGVSPAQVQYYFRSKNELLTAAFERVSDDVLAQASAIDTSGPQREVLRTLLHVWPVRPGRSRLVSYHASQESRARSCAVPNLGVGELLIIAVVVLVLFGSKKLPDASRALGRSLRIFKSETKGLHDDDDEAQQRPATNQFPARGGDEQSNARTAERGSGS